jgi:hypothetical protein
MYAEFYTRSDAQAVLSLLGDETNCKDSTVVRH